jgi:hypothetical protein
MTLIFVPDFTRLVVTFHSFSLNIYVSGWTIHKWCISTCMYVYNDNRLPEEGRKPKCRNIVHGWWGFLAELSNRFVCIVGCDVCIGKNTCRGFRGRQSLKFLTWRRRQQGLPKFGIRLPKYTLIFIACMKLTSDSRHYNTANFTGLLLSN